MPSGLRVAVTAGAAGIGRAIAEQLAAEGASLAICARNADEVQSTVEALSAAGVSCTGAAVDVSDRDAYQAWIGTAAEEMGGIDIFIPNVSAGGGQMDESGWRANFEVDLLGTTRGIEAALPHLQASDAGAIVIIATTAAVETFLGPQPYNAIKAALITHGKQLSQALAGDGIRVNCVSPGPIYFAGGAWEFIENNMPDIYNATLADIPTSPAASLITGVNLVADGGFTKRVQL